MSIGSETSGGVSGIKVVDLTLDGTDHGIRIKSDRSRGGLVEGVSYENVCMRNVGNPILLDTKYTAFAGDKIPVYRNIVLKDVNSVTPGGLALLGFDEKNRLGLTLDNVTVAGPPSRVGTRRALLDGSHSGRVWEPSQGSPINDLRAEHADVTIGPRRGNFTPAGIDVSVNDGGAKASAPVDCNARFVPFPDVSAAPTAAMKVPPRTAPSTWRPPAAATTTPSSAPSTWRRRRAR